MEKLRWLPREKRQLEVLLTEELLVRYNFVMGKCHSRIFV